MNVRDPFNLHRKSALSILKATATRAAVGVTERAVEVTERAVEVGAQAIEKSKQAVEDLDMSFAIPKNVPSFGNPQRIVEDHIWGNSAVTSRAGAGARAASINANTNAGILAGVQDRVGGLFENKNTLPMYKDKPYAYPPSQRAKPLWRRKRVLGFVLALLALLYFFGASRRHNRADDPTKRPLWGWLNQDTDHAKKTDWNMRREMVVDAFTLSWDAYERYAWGMFLPRPVLFR